MRTKYGFGLILIATVIILLHSCDIFDCLQGNGILKSEQRLVAEFTGVENSTSFDVEIMADSAYSVEVIADENLLPFIETSVRSGTLIIETNYGHCIDPHSYVRVEIHMPVIDFVELTGSGDMDVNDVDGNNLEVKNSGSGDININNIFLTTTLNIDLYGSGDIAAYGKAHQGNYHLAGSGDILADDLQVELCYVTSSGSGDVYCYVYELLDVEINGSGDVLYSGPIDASNIQLEDNGSGDLIERN